ncbi:hypothetical protein CEP54_015416 [Fusarium duplospermum]|uniref:Uncharacterized protein n=1 Tax=Fusarium duplospermum TaxID=1325734 RepID=A0A428NP98_9HYPO|nr:hypothetical protein CEP54_015416 [Fusarium duplospermum]
MRKRGSTAIKKNHQFGKDCNTIAVLLFYNKIHGFWDGSGHVPEGESLPDNMNEVVISDGELILRPARERKQPIKTKPCKVTKPAPAPAPAQTRNLRSLRSRKQQPEDVPPMSSASPALTQILVAGSEIGADDRDASIWDIPSTPPAEATIEVRGDDDISDDERSIGTTDARDEVDGDDEDEGSGGNIDNSSRLMEPGTLAPHRRRADLQHRPNDVAPSPSTADRDAEGELCAWLDEPLVPMGSWANDVVGISEPGNEPAPVDFTTMMADDAWMPSTEMGFGDAPDFVDTSGFPSMLDFDFGNMGLDIDMNMDGTGWFEQFSVPPATEVMPPITESVQPVTEIVPAESMPTESMPTEIMPPSLMDLSSACPEATPPLAFSEHKDGRGNSGLPNTVAEEKDWQQPVYVTGSQLLAVITQSLHKMNGHENTEWDSSSCKDVGRSMRAHHGFDTPLATPVC